jgi:uncharacterized membrane protein
MTVSGDVLAIIIAMSVITVLTRLGGYWLSGRFVISPRMEAAFELIPGTILTALVAPAVVNEGVNGAIATGLAILLMRKTGNLIVTLIASLGLLILLRNFS